MRTFAAARNSEHFQSSPANALTSRSGGHSERAQKSPGCGVAKIYRWRCGRRERLAAEPAHQAAEDDLPVAKRGWPKLLDRGALCQIALERSTPVVPDFLEDLVSDNLLDALSRGVHWPPQACKVLALLIIVRFFGQSRHSSGRFPSGVALLHVVGSALASRKTYYTAVGSRRTQLLLNGNRGINSARSSTCRTGRAPIASHPWAGLGVAAEPPSAGRVNASCEGQRRCASSLCQRGNISTRSRRRLGEAILCRPCSESYGSHVAVPPARERAYIAMCIEDKRNRQLRSWTPASVRSQNRGFDATLTRHGAPLGQTADTGGRNLQAVDVKTSCNPSPSDANGARGATRRRGRLRRMRSRRR